MEVILRTGFAAITHAIDFNPQTIKKGQALTVSHVRRVEEYSPSEASCGRICCSVVRQTNVTSPPYKVKLHIDHTRHVFSVDCTCISAEGKKCKHVYALIHYINSDRSATKTSLEQEWGKPSDSQLGKEIYAKGIVITDYFKTKTKQKEVNIIPYVSKLSDFGGSLCALRTILREQSRTEADRICRTILKDCLDQAIDISGKKSCETCAINLSIFAEESELYLGDVHISDAGLNQFYQENVVLTPSEITHLCLRTNDQSNCREWFDARKLRITASSKAHSIKTRRKNDFFVLLAKFLDESKPASCKALDYGTKKEKIAVADYERQFNARVFHVGLVVLHSQPWLSASPDGIVVEDGCITKLLEVKCPFVCKNSPVFDSVTEKFNVPYLQLVNNNVELKTSHQYYTQVQMQMYVTGLSECDLFVWSPKGSHRLTVLTE